MAGFIAATLDGLAAVVLLSGMHFRGVFRYIAGVLMGKERAHQDGDSAVLLGVLIHYGIAFSFTALFFILYSRVFTRYPVILNAVVYGVFVWIIMNLIVLPLASVHLHNTPRNIIINCTILIVGIGLPLAYFAKQAYKVDNGF